MAYGVAPKVQGANMTPRQGAMNRALEKPKSGVGVAQAKEPKPLSQQWINPQNKGSKPPATQTPLGMNAQNQMTNPVLASPIKNGNQLIGGKYTPPGPVGPPGVIDPYSTGDPELDKYLAGDETYQQILASLERNKSDASSLLAYNQGNLNTDNDTILRRLKEQEDKDNKLLSDDYAARGLFGSGLNAKAASDLGQNYAQQNSDLSTSLARSLQQLQLDYDNQMNLDDETRRQAQLDAITRRAQQFGIMGGPANSTGTKPKDKDKGKEKDKPKGQGAKPVEPNKGKKGKR